jgi:hypothetical protein
MKRTRHHVDTVLDTLRQRAEPYGLNLIGALPLSRYDAAVPPSAAAGAVASWARSIVVIGNGGGDFWAGFQRHLARQPEWSARDNPLDDYTRFLVETEILPRVSAAGLRCEVCYPFLDQPRRLHFMELGKLAGIGAPSLLGVLVNPAYGPWIALRAALLIEAEIDRPASAAGFDPCPRCVARTCIVACPASAVDPRGWNPYQCMEHRVRTQPGCASGCHSRIACVLAPEARYPQDEITYHQEQALRSMRAYYRSHR